MRCPAAVLALLATATSTAMADEADELVASGEELARRGEYSRAIEQFKQADARRPRARNACLIALTYTRRELWAQAEIALASCHARAGTGDPLPAWVDELDRTLATKLDAVDVAPISIRVEPPSPSATISISSFSPDETFAPRVVHLAPGTYTVTAAVPGRARVTSTIVVVDRAPQTVTLQVVPPEPPSRMPWLLIGAGGLLAAGGLAFDLLAVQPARSRLEDAAGTLNGSAWVEHSRTFDRRRALTVGMFAGAAIAAGVGVALRLTVYRREVVVVAGANGITLVGAL
jgi:hypothetical protein